MIHHVPICMTPTHTSCATILKYQQTLTMLQKPTMIFLEDLNYNNNREWFAEHKPKYQTALADFKKLIHTVAEGIAQFDTKIADTLENPKTVKVFRIYRDARFSKDKTPYKTNFGGIITADGQDSGNPGYYLHVSPDESFVGGGFHRPDRTILANIRASIADNSKPLTKIINSKKFKTEFNGLETYDTLKTAPRGYPKDHKDVEYLRLKSFTVFKKITTQELFKENLVENVIASCRALKPLNDYLRKIK